MSVDEAETRARTMGWMPKDKFVAEGQPEANWLPAADYIKRGEGIMPILKANNKKLSSQLTTMEGELRSTKQMLKEASEAIEELKTFRSSLNKDKVKDQKATVLSALAEAKKSGNTEAEVQLTDQLSELNVSLREAEKPAPKPEVKPDPDAPSLTPESKEWMQENPWFGSDRRKTAVAMAIADEWKASGKRLGTSDFFEHVDAEVGKLFDQNAERRGAPPKVEGGGGGGGPGPTTGRTYADLPPEAQAACENSARRLVGPNRAYKTKADWQKAYIETYDWS